MALLDAFLIEAARFNIWIAARTDGIAGSGTAQDPYNGSVRQDSPLAVLLSYVNEAPQGALASTAPFAHHFVNGDVVIISGVAGTFAPNWNGTFGIYGVTEFGFRYFMKKPMPPDQPVPGSPTCVRLTFSVDQVLRAVPANIQIRLGPGTYQTRGFAPNDSRGWQPKTGQKIVGAGVDVTTLQLVGAENADQHYHVVGMPIEPSGTTAIVPLETFEISDLTIDCNVDNQPTRLDRYTSINVSNLVRTGRVATATIPAGHNLHDGDFVAMAGVTSDPNLWNGMFRIGNVQSGSFDYAMSDVPGTSPPSGTITALRIIPYPNVACGAVRIFGNHSRVSRVKAVNFGTKSFKQGCFVISIIHASGQPTGGDTQPIVTEKQDNGIEDCVAIQPSKNNAREVTILHIGGLKNSDNHAQGFGRASFIRRNFVDCQFLTSYDTANSDVNLQTPKPFSSVFITSKSSTTINQTTNVGNFVGKRLHYRNALDFETFARFYNPKDPLSRWNGYAQIARFTDDTLLVTLGPPTPNTAEDNSFVIMGTEFRAIAVSSCVAAVIQENHIYNCWIGGPYQSPLDDSVSDPTTPPTLAREERLDPLNALNTRSLIVRNNFFKTVAAGPYCNMGGVSAAVGNNTISYNSSTGIVTVTTSKNHKLWGNARVKLEFTTAQPDYDGIRDITAVTDTTFQYQAVPGLATAPSGTPSYRVVAGVDYLTIDGNVIELADLDETEFAIKEYPLASSSAAQQYRAYGIIVADNGLSALAGPHAHRQVFIRNNKIRYINGLKVSTVPGIGLPAGAAMQLTGIKTLHVTHNVIDVNPTPSQRTFRCGTVRFFHNNRPDGELRRGWKGDTKGSCINKF